jgi:hypothetical protein
LAFSKCPSPRTSPSAALIVRLFAHVYRLVEDQPLQGYYRRYVDDPFGNQIELMTAGHMI